MMREKFKQVKEYIIYRKFNSSKFMFKSNLILLIDRFCFYTNEQVHFCGYCASFIIIIINKSKPKNTVRVAYNLLNFF